MKACVKTVMAAPEEDGVDYSAIINFTSHTTGSCVCVLKYICIYIYIYIYIYTHTHTHNNGSPITLDCGTVVRFQANFELRYMNNFTPYDCSAFARIWVNSQRLIYRVIEKDGRDLKPL